MIQFRCCILYVIDQTRENGLFHIPTPRNVLKKQGVPELVFFNAFRDVWIRDKTLYIYIVFDLASLQQVPAFKKRTYKKLQPATIL